MVVGIFPNRGKNRIVEAVDRIVSCLEKLNIDFFMSDSDARHFGLTDHGLSMLELVKKIDCAISIGGDGTMIKCAREVAQYDIPVCGINLGKVGFLNDIEFDDIETALNDLAEAKFIIKERMMLKVEVLRGRELCFSGVALNDAVISKSGLSRLLRLSVSIEAGLVEKYPADGIIIATPTGSTGYSLSANGPIIHPSVKVLIVTPICPHLLHSRSIIVACEEKIIVEFDPVKEEAILTLDGQLDYKLDNRDKIVITQSPYSAKLIKLFDSKPFFEVVREKLHEH
ncbi:MAG: NAD(+)/NADH kinase [Negativicutes bacterium]|jgi:NAD+ kinase